MKRIPYCFLFSVILAASPIAAAMENPVTTKSGKVSGIPGSDPAITAFKGIPFAAPPVGELRWRSPQPPPPWQGVRNAANFGASCIQTIVKERKPWTYEFMTHSEISEDCLFLNVWTPAKFSTEKHPVFFYIYGGGFSEGSGAVPVYDGEGLAKKGLVVVTANYRIGLLGFLAHPELSKESGYKASGNYGLLDQMAALRWVHDNIAAFGGDPGCVTIAGQSAGGMSVHDLIASPLAKGLVHRAIVQSGGSSVGGGGISMGTLAESEVDGLGFAKSKGANSLAELRAVTWQKLTEAAPAAIGRGRSGPSLFPFSPIVDGYVLPMPVRESMAQGKQNDVPTLTGVNAGELGGLTGPPSPPTSESFIRWARQRYSLLADEFLRIYPAATDQEAALAQAQSSRDQSLVSLYLWAKQRAAKAKTKSFIYLWDHAMPGPDVAQYGAFHSSEVPYVLNTLYRSDRPFTEEDRKIAAMMSSYWANFAATGDPNGKGLPQWNPVGDKHEVMEVGDKTGTIPAAADKPKFAFFEKYLNPNHILDAIDTGFAFVAAFINGLFVLLILTRTSRAAVYITFLLNCVAAVIWTFCDFMVLVTDHKFWFYISLIGTGFVPALMFHFISALVGMTKNRRWITAGYILCSPFALSSPLALKYSGIQSFVDSKVWNELFMILFSASFLAGVIILARAIRGAKSKSEASRFRYVLVAVCIACFSGSTDLLQILKVPIPPLGHVGTVIYSSVLAIGVFKHRAAYDLLAEMRSKLEMINELAAGIAHELRNPLSSIKGAASLLRDKSGTMTVEQSRDYLNLISEEIARLDAILTNYRCLVRPQKIEIEPVRINTVLEKTVALMRMNENAPKIELNLSHDIPLCKSDPQTLRQVFINLIKNAQESCGAEGMLRIASEHVAPSIRITFMDTGKGVPPEILPRIFEPFVSTKTNGMGLGLAICRRLVDLNGGTIEAANKIGGACFIIHLPAGNALLPPA